MKKNIYILLAATLAATSCTNLNEVVYDQLTDQKYYENFSESDIPGAIATVYSDLRQLYATTGAHTNGCYLYTNEEVGDSWVTPSRNTAWYDGGIYINLNQHKWTIDHAHFLNNWRLAYKSINTCNRLLYEFSSADIPDETKAKLEAELRVARAFWYYVLCDMYGNVPLITSYVTPKGWLPETSPRADIFDFLVTEIQETRNLLSAKSYGRWDQGAAAMLLAKIYLNAEVWIGEPHWDEVVALCDEIIDSPNYSLDGDYKSIFVTENQGSPEIIMAACNDEKYDYTAFEIHLWSHYWDAKYHYDTETWFWGGCCATPELANSYDSDDKRFEKSWAEGKLYDNTGEKTGIPGSPLLCVSDPLDVEARRQVEYTRDIPIYHPGDPTRMTGEGPGVRMNKYEVKRKAKNLLSNDFVIFRYADVLFMKAEALWRDAGNIADQTVCDLINDVRRRAFDNFTEDKKVTPSNLTADRFLQEYAWEFCQEGHRRQQMIRFGVFTTKSWFDHTPSIDPKWNLFPIPYEELLANENLVQNPGYPRTPEF